jgi:hypothetical protein
MEKKKKYPYLGFSELTGKVYIVVGDGKKTEVDPEHISKIAKLQKRWHRANGLTVPKWVGEHNKSV